MSEATGAAETEGSLPTGPTDLRLVVTWVDTEGVFASDEALEEGVSINAAREIALAALEVRRAPGISSLHSAVVKRGPHSSTEMGAWHFSPDLHSDPVWVKGLR
jgi:hypothetical protein